MQFYSNVSCSVLKDEEAIKMTGSYKIEHFSLVIRFQGKWIYIKTSDVPGYQLVSSCINDTETIISSIKRELYRKTGIVAGRIYEVATYSLSTGYGKSCKYRRKTSYGKLFFVECDCLGKLPDKKSEILCSETEPSDSQLTFSEASAPLMRKAKSWLLSGGTEKQIPHLFEKLCGAVTFCRDGDTFRYILIKNLSGHIGFPKGHSENGESEFDTCAREVFEETGLRPRTYLQFRHAFSYTAPADKKVLNLPEPTDMHKYAVYFAAEFNKKDIPNIKIQEEEVLNWWLVPYNEAIRLLNKNTDKRLLELARRHIEHI